MSEEPPEYQKANVPFEQRTSMKFTIALADLESLLKAVVSRPRKADTVILSACAARVFIECKGNVAGVVGYETNLPFSKIVSDRWTLHFNAGMSVFPNAHDKRHLTNYNVGASAIYAVSRDFNLMLEALGGWNEDVTEGVFAFEETVERNTTAIISPGARYAFNLPNEAQPVIGAALPIGLTPDSPDWGMFSCCSVEHPFIHPESRLTT